MTSFVFWAYLIGSAFTTIAVLSGISMMQYKLGARARRTREEEMQAAWRPIFAGISVAGADFERCPPLPKDTVPAFLELWLYWLSMLAGEDRERLIQLGQQLGLVPLARRMLLSPQADRRVLGASVAGYLKDDSAWPHLTALLDHGDRKVQLAAGRALLQIDPARAMPPILARVAHARGWAGRDLQALLRDVPLDTIQDDLWAMAQDASPAIGARLVHVICSLNPVKCRSVIKAILTAQPAYPADMLSAALAGITDPRDAHLARAYVQHSEGHVRRNAVGALGRVGLADDLPAIASVLSDPSWWVRIRAAQVLYAFPGMNGRKIAELTQALSDVYGQDALLHARAEHLTSLRWRKRKP